MKKLVLLIAVAAGVYWFWDEIRSNIGDVVKPAAPGTLRSEPLQSATQRKDFQMGNYRVHPLADYKIEARVYGRKVYNDRQADIVPQDLALGWGMMSEEKNAAKIEVTQDGRFSNISMAGFSGNVREMQRSMSNVHIISANAQIAQFISSLSVGDFVSLRGCLVGLRAKDGSHVESSLSRDDMDAGACEVFYVEHASRLKPDGSPQGAGAVSSPSAARPVAGLPATAPRPSPPAEREVLLKTSLSAPLDHGHLTIPAGEKIVILGQEGTRTKARYRGITFWVNSAAVK